MLTYKRSQSVLRPSLSKKDDGSIWLLSGEWEGHCFVYKDKEFRCNMKTLQSWGGFKYLERQALFLGGKKEYPKLNGKKKEDGEREEIKFGGRWVSAHVIV